MERRAGLPFLAFTPDVKVQAAKIARELRKSVPLVRDVMGRSLGAQLKAAAGSGAKFVVIVGKDELDAGKLTLRDMSGGAQESLSLGGDCGKAKRAFLRLMIAQGSGPSSLTKALFFIFCDFYVNAVDSIISIKKARTTAERMIRSEYLLFNIVSTNAVVSFR